MTSLSNRVGRPMTGGPITIVRKSVFHEIGGFADIIGEDIEINRRLKRKGRIFRDPEISAYSSSRRFEKEGMLKNLVKYALCKMVVALDRDIEIGYPPTR